MSDTHPLTLHWDDGLDQNDAPLTDLSEVRRRIVALDGGHRTLAMIGAGVKRTWPAAATAGPGSSCTRPPTTRPSIS